MNRNDIKSLLVKRDITQKEIADALEISAGCVSGVINGRYQSRRVKEYIAGLLKIRYEKLWGKAAA